jgi:hypothetical protein
MLNSDVNALDELLAPELTFTNHLGLIMSKNDDLEAHKSGMLHIEVLTPSEQKIQFIGDVAIVTVRMHILGSYANTKSEADFRFTRIWALSSSGACDTWQVVAGHSSVVA